MKPTLELSPAVVPRVDRDPVAFDRALVVRFGRVGDMIVVTPFLRALDRASPGGTVDLLATPAGASVLATNPHLRRRWTLKWRKPPVWLNPEKRSLLRRLARERYDLVFLLERSPRYHGFVGRLEGPELFAMCRPEESPGPRRARPDPREHAAAKFDRLLALAGVPHAGWRCEYPVPEAARTRASELLATRGVESERPLVGLHPGHYRRRRHRRRPHPKAWPPERFAAVIEELARRSDAFFLLTGTEDEADLTARVAASTGVDRVLDLAGATDLPTLAAVQERCGLFVSGDTGPAHLAAAVGTPLVALFGPTPPWDMGPLGQASRIRRLWPDPSPESPSRRGGYHPRLWAVEPEDVLAAAAEVAPELTGPPDVAPEPTAPPETGG